MGPNRLAFSTAGGWALAFVVIVFLSTGIRFTVGPVLKPMTADLGRSSR
jgi:hypothetical protein